MDAELASDRLSKLNELLHVRTIVVRGHLPEKTRYGVLREGHVSLGNEAGIAIGGVKA